MLGFAYADQFSPYRLHRENPQAHPTLPWHYAQTIHFSAMSPRTDPELSDPEGTSTYPAVFVTNDLSKTTYFGNVYTTVRFVPGPYDLRRDTYITVPSDELDRNCYFEPTFQTKLIQADGVSQMVWAQTSVGPPKGPNIAPPGNMVLNMFATE